MGKTGKPLRKAADLEKLSHLKWRRLKWDSGSHCGALQGGQEVRIGIDKYGNDFVGNRS